MKSGKDGLQPEAMMLQSILDALPFCVFWKDLNGVGLGCNKALANVAGLASPQDYIGKTDYELPWTKEEADFFRECDRRVMESGIAEVNIVESQQQSDGQTAWLETSKIPLVDIEGNVIGILGAFHDITERKLLEDEHIETQKLDSLGVLAAGLAHDFNNILAMILASSQLAKVKASNGAAADTVINHLDGIEKGAKRASALTEKFMSYSERGDATKVLCDVSEIIKESIAFVKSSLNPSVRFNDLKITGLVYADLNQLNQVINNLLINATQASSGETEVVIDAKHIELTHTHHSNLQPGTYIAISIKDNGSGISESVINNIFDPYYTTKKNGRGLGLTSCKTIINNHNGALQVESILGAGSTFTVLLPTAPSQQDVPIVHHPFSKELVYGSGRILYVEDDIHTQASITELLEELGYTVQSYSYLESAMGYIKSQPNEYDLVITDFIIGDHRSGGAEILNGVRSSRPHCPVILISGYFEQPNSEQFENCSFSYIARKPVDFVKISQVIKRLI